ncbi:MAG: glutamine-hydrolyzing carbamoyl-phosphate synthase small subunit [Dehalococcoidia bacterium]|nr:glutamine-hydrolyzing carbamoyl-phosphate synthase small subunit [Dehalococcoidia bacterium]
MTKRAILLLQDGSIYEGQSIGADIDACGEVVFNTSMIGYQELLTDPSYAGQIVIPTYPLIGNYGINEYDMDSGRIQAQGFAVRESCFKPSHYQSQKTLDSYLSEADIPGIAGLDTRSITRKLRNHGVMMGVLTSTRTPQEAAELLRSTPSYDTQDFVKKISAKESFFFRPEDGPRRRNIVIVDYGCKYSIMRIIHRLDCNVKVMPCTATAKEILGSNPDGILLSPGPGNPEVLDYAVYNIRGLIGYKPILGICLGGQLVARAFGGKTFKLKFGHRGGNHPVKELSTECVHISAQNHGYAVDPDSLNNGLNVSHISLNDNTVEGLLHKELPILTIQYHLETSLGPHDNLNIFDQFMQLVDSEKNNFHCDERAGEDKIDY